MIKNIFNLASQNKNTVMFLTSTSYILGLVAFFNNQAIIMSVLLTIFGVLVVLKNYFNPKLVLFWIFLFYFAYFNASFQIKPLDELYTIAPLNTKITGQITSIPNSNFQNKVKFFFNVSSIELTDNKIKPLNAKTLVTVFDENNDFANLKIGNYYTIQGALRTPFDAVNPSQFDYGKYLKNFRTSTLFYAENYQIKQVNQKLNFKWKFLQNLNDTRVNIINQHSKYLKSPNLEILGGIVFGDDAVAPPDYIKTSFINSGLLHILAASGMNVAFIYGFWFFLLRKLKIPYKITVLTGIGIVCLYALMTGLGASVIRAAFMLVFILIGKLIDKDTHSISLLSLVALLMLIYNPAYINHVSFQLSFVVTFGLLISTNVMLELFKHFKPWQNGVLSAILIPIIAQIWVAPIQMFYFNTFSLYSIFANIAIAPFLCIISFAGFISSILAIIKPISNFVCLVFDFVLNPFLTVLVNISNYFSNLPNSLITTLKPSFFQIFLYYSIILLLTLMIKTEIKTKKLVIASALLIFVLLVSTINIPDKNLEIIAFSVQNADSFLVKTPENKYFIIDTGKPPYKNGNSQAKTIILNYLKDRRIKNFEAMILTHFDSDHTGGAVDLINNLKFKYILVNSLNPNTKTSTKIFQTAESKNIPVILVKNNQILYQESNLNIKTYCANLKGKIFENENSIITFLTYKDFSILFMGDSGVIAFEKLKDNLPENVNFLKLGHHGAKNVINKEMLAYLNPKEIIISVGNNSFAHPNPMTLNILKNTPTHRTDKKNSILIKSNGYTYSTYSYSKEHAKYIKMP